jgi:hypothetical protein
VVVEGVVISIRIVVVVGSPSFILIFGLSFLQDFLPIVEIIVVSPGDLPRAWATIVGEVAIVVVVFSL